ncbi:MAG: hypothetical protein N2688_07485 [Burkholderiaceae bacterium]|nr:hypothetical protein [Burkholderiaceae bacterium]
MRRGTVTAGLMRALGYALAIAGVAPAQAQGAANVGAELSPGVSWMPYGALTRPVDLRPLTAAEVRLAQQRAAGFYAAFRASASFSTPRDRAHLVTSSAAIERPSESNRAPAPVLQQSITAYWSAPRDARRKPDGVLTPVLGGAHELVYFDTNVVPRADQLVDRATAGDFTRGVTDGRHGGFFAQPRVLGQLGGGTVYADVIVLTRDGAAALAPAPIGALLDLEIERLSRIVAEIERGAAERLREAEAGMAPDRVAERRAKREQAWSRETRDPALLAQRLDAAHRSDLADLERTRRDFAIPEQPDPRHRYWGPKLALDAARKLAASLDAAGRERPACGRVEPGFSGSDGVRFEVAGSAPDCVPMVQVRGDLLDSKRPLEDVQVLVVSFRGSRCGEVIGGVRPLPGSGRCGYGVPLLREMDWSLARKALGW